jgi:hypothetical protein
MARWPCFTSASYRARAVLSPVLRRARLNRYDDTWRAMLTRQVRLAWEAGALDQLPIMLSALGHGRGVER